MSAKKNDISQLHKYLKGELDTRAMHRFERETQDDPFLIDALEGYETADNDQQVNLAELHERLAKRIAPKKERIIILWRLLPIAACFLIVVGYWYYTTKPSKQQLATIITANKPKQPVIQHPSTESTVVVQNIPVKHRRTIITKQQPVITVPQHNDLIASAIPVSPENKVTYKTDTVQYRASDYKVRENATVNELLRKMQGMEVDSNGNITKKYPDAIDKARLNGKDYAGGDVTKAVKNLPADIVAKEQIVNDYGNQADKTTYVLQEKTAGLNVSRADNNILTGKVVDEKGLPLPGVVVKVKSTPSIATVTDPNGNYKLALPDNKATLVYSFEGFDSQEQPTAGKKAINITMTSNNSALSEVVVVAYGSQKKSSVTGAVSVKKDTGKATITTSLPDETVSQTALSKNTSSKTPQPVNGRKKYQLYVSQNAIMPDGTTGKVKLTFSIAADGSVHDVHTLNGRNTAIDEAAINIVKNGPKWLPGTKSNEVSLKIKFHKKN